MYPNWERLNWGTLELQDRWKRHPLAYLKREHILIWLQKYIRENAIIRQWIFIHLEQYYIVF